MVKRSLYIVKIVFGIALAVSVALYLAFGYRWTKMFFAIMLAVFSIYNLFFNRPSRD